MGDASVWVQGAFGMSVIAIVYWLVAKATAVGLLKDKRLRFAVPGAMWAILVLLWAWSEAFKQSALVYVIVWMAGWVATMLFKDGVQNNEKKQ